MLKLNVRMEEGFDAEKAQFVTLSSFDLELEHSLFSVSKWESFFEKPFLNEKDKSTYETLWYVKAMALTPDVPPEVFAKLSDADVTEINTYISSKQTATWFKETPANGTLGRTITSEVVYSWMITLGIPFECQHWHFNRLLTLIKVRNEENQPPAKKSKADMARERRELNRKRREQYGTSG